MDISNPTAPVIVGSLQDTTNLKNGHGLFVSGRYAYVAASTTDTIAIIDINNPASPSLAGSITNATSLDRAQDVWIAGDYAYATSQDDYLTVINVSNPSAPVIVGSVSSATQLDAAAGLFVSGGRAYVAGFNDDMITVVGLTRTEVPTLYAGAIETGSLSLNDSLYAAGDLYAGGGLNVGLSGIFSRGGIAAYVASSTATNPIAGLFMGGNVGIGTTSPMSLLTVQGTDTAGILTLASSDTSVGAGEAIGALKFYSSDTSTNGSGVKASISALENDGGAGRSYDLAFSTANQPTLAEHMRITYGGNVGIGTTTPDQKLVVVGNSSPAISIFDNSSATLGRGGALFLQHTNAAGSAVNYAGLNAYALDGTTGAEDGHLVLKTMLGGTLTEAVRILNTGNVGIGTTSPLAKLDVAGANNATVPLLQLSSVASFATTTRLLVTNAGLVGVGVASPTYHVDVAGFINTDQFSGYKQAGNTVLYASSTNFSGSPLFHVGSLRSSFPAIR